MLGPVGGTQHSFKGRDSTLPPPIWFKVQVCELLGGLEEEGGHVIRKCGDCGTRGDFVPVLAPGADRNRVPQ